MQLETAKHIHYVFVIHIDKIISYELHSLVFLQACDTLVMHLLVILQMSMQ